MVETGEAGFEHLVSNYFEAQCFSELIVFVRISEPTIRMLILEMVAVLLEHHSRLCASDHESDIENKERLFDVPIRMVSDITQQVCVCVCTRDTQLSSISQMSDIFWTRQTKAHYSLSCPAPFE